jgi:hypothetical protein
MVKREAQMRCRNYHVIWLMRHIFLAGLGYKFGGSNRCIMR